MASQSSCPYTLAPRHRRVLGGGGVSVGIDQTQAVLRRSSCPCSCGRECKSAKSRWLQPTSDLRSDRSGHSLEPQAKSQSRSCCSKGRDCGRRDELRRSAAVSPSVAVAACARLWPCGSHSTSPRNVRTRLSCRVVVPLCGAYVNPPRARMPVMSTHVRRRRTMSTTQHHSTPLNTAQHHSTPPTVGVQG